MLVIRTPCLGRDCLPQRPIFHVLVKSALMFYPKYSTLQTNYQVQRLLTHGQFHPTPKTDDAGARPVGAREKKLSGSHKGGAIYVSSSEYRPESSSADLGIDQSNVHIRDNAGGKWVFLASVLIRLAPRRHVPWPTFRGANLARFHEFGRARGQDR